MRPQDKRPVKKIINSITPLERRLQLKFDVKERPLHPFIWSMFVIKFMRWKEIQSSSYRAKFNVSTEIQLGGSNRFFLDLINICMICKDGISRQIEIDISKMTTSDEIVEQIYKTTNQYLDGILDEEYEIEEMKKEQVELACKNYLSKYSFSTTRRSLSFVVIVSPPESIAAINDVMYKQTKFFRARRQK